MLENLYYSVTGKIHPHSRLRALDPGNGGAGPDHRDGHRRGAGARRRAFRAHPPERPPAGLRSRLGAATYPVYPRPGDSRAAIRGLGDGRYQVQIGAADIGTGAWTILTQIAADALKVPLGLIEVQLGDSTLPAATPAAGAMGTSNWCSAITAMARAFRAQHGNQPGPGAEATATDPENPSAGKVAMHAFGAQFADTVRSASRACSASSRPAA